MTPTAPRREQLLEAAAQLFADRGYHSVGIDDIGAAAGITGPGVYRHFSGKQALLEQLCERAMSRVLQGAEAVARDHGTHDGGDPHVLEALVELHIDFAVGQRALLGVWAREQRALSDDVRHALRVRERAYEQVWREVVQPLRDDLSPDETSVTVSSTLALLNSTPLVARTVPADRLHELLRAMALAALLSQPRPAGACSTAPAGRAGLSRT